MDEERCRKLAEYEAGWWKAHHRKDINLLMEQMAKLYELQFGIPYNTALEAVKYRVEATKEHDIAERLEDQGSPDSEIHWKQVEKLLLEHFKLL